MTKQELNDVLQEEAKKECLKLELTGKELGAIYDWMQYADTGEDSPFMSNDKDIRALVNKIQNKYDCYRNLNDK